MPVEITEIFYPKVRREWRQGKMYGTVPIEG